MDSKFHEITDRLGKVEEKTDANIEELKMHGSRLAEHDKTLEAYKKNVSLALFSELILASIT
eukprot:3814554-Karenia_brevis.AAC.1